MPDITPGPDDPALDALFHALSDPRRRDMVARLSRDPMSVKELAEPLGMRLPSAVKHLAVLESGGLVVSEKEGRVRTYRMKTEAFDRVRRWIEQREIELSAAFDRLEQAISDFPEDQDK
ncbi:ArsR/SmtB family transcription factor [Roseovarius atlanticus]|uniref:ArsR/SmtB family transcription factor n=1 Tax=Roseovarius atlanticus TaxID=1641875 RepID=UPI001C941A96|nr:metalloregulator ArsR/SmtB family transcription factor [Roseovarius atlanticus]MBY5989690.1 metalloregulator ArsR/SmtB family transcription factor [Roseovarius atlanticus]MBY6126235.1 metalloregulator ArsR/SmtB family transcription factor [Roseovarius atlanticus]MBY6150729.1 metalloregulator ArsR/SmtB family transcription factor [Roseovarius atlanticus]